MNNRLLVPQKLPLLLDYAPGAAAAYSLRSLSNSYVGPVVTVRRSTDSAEADFTATEVSDGTLAAWCGGGDGFVKQWWDQSGNVRHASQTDSAKQPKVCVSGAITQKDGIPAILFQSINKTGLKGAVASSSVSVPYAMFCVYQSADSAAYIAGFNRETGANTVEGIRKSAANTLQAIQQNGESTAQAIFTADDASWHMAEMVTQGTASAMTFYGKADAGPASEYSTPRVRDVSAIDRLLAIGFAYNLPETTFAAEFLDGYIAEIVVFEGDLQPSLTSRIQGDLAWYY